MTRANFVVLCAAIPTQCAVAMSIRSTGTYVGACARGAALSEISSDEFDNEAAYTEVTRHPTGLTFRKHILDDDKIRRLESGVWEMEEQPYIEKAFNSDPNCTRALFIDGGAAFGYYSILASVRNPCREVQAFNPHPRFAEVMKLNVQDNVKSGVLTSPRICINKVALSSEEGMANIDFGYGEHISRANVPVSMTSLDAFVENNVPGDKKILLVKLDVEGQEANVMKGAAKLLRGCRVKFWSIGIHGAHLLKPVVDALEDNGYAITSAVAVVEGQPNGQVTAEC